MSEQIIVKFDYNTALLNKVVKDARAINTADMAQVEQTKKELVTLRGKIQAQGKGFREQAIAYNKEVLKQENEFVGLIEPIEIEYKEILKKDNEKKVIEARKELLPMKKRQLQALTKIVMTDDESILEMNDEQWVAYYNAQFQINEERTQYEEMRIRQEKERVEREAEIREEMETKAKLDAEQALKQAQEDQINAVQAEKDKAEDQANKEKERHQAQKQAEDNAEKARLKKEVEEKAKMESNKRYQAWLEENNYNEKDGMILQETADNILLYKLVSKYDK